MLDRVKFDTVSVVSKIEVRTQEEVDREEEMRRERLMQALQTQHAEAQSALFAAAPEAGAPGVPPRGMPGGPTSAAIGSGFASALADSVVDPNATFIRQDRKVGRNEPCPCGSGKKFKHCHGALSE